MNLPTEIRVKILRNLLRRGEVLRFISTAWEVTTKQPMTLDHFEETKKYTQLSSQLLRCCQALLREGRQILYEENTLQICCLFDSGVPPRICMLAGTALVDLEDTFYTGSFNGTFLKPLDGDLCEELRTQFMLDNVSTMMRFRSVEVHILYIRLRAFSIVEYRRLFTVVRKLAALMRDKKIHIVEHDLPQDFLPALKVWQMKDFTFASSEYVGWRGGTLNPACLLSNEPFRDTSSLWVEVYAQIPLHHEEVQRDLKVALLKDKFEAEVFNHNYGAAVEAKTKLLKLAEQRYAEIRAQEDRQGSWLSTQELSAQND